MLGHLPINLDLCMVPPSSKGHFSTQTSLCNCSQCWGAVGYVHLRIAKDNGNQAMRCHQGMFGRCAGKYNNDRCHDRGISDQRSCENVQLQNKPADLLWDFMVGCGRHFAQMTNEYQIVCNQIAWHRVRIYVIIKLAVPNKNSCLTSSRTEHRYAPNNCDITKY